MGDGGWEGESGGEGWREDVDLEEWGVSSWIEGEWEFLRGEV